MTDWTRGEGGTCEAQLFLAEPADGSGPLACVAKLPDNPRGVRALVNEWVAAGLLDLLGLTHPASFALDVAPGTIPAGARYLSGVPVGPGLAFASTYLASSTPLGCPPLTHLVNPGTVAGVVLFDVWTYNADVRQLRLVPAGPGQSRGRAYAVDQDGCLAGHRWTAAALAQAADPFLTVAQDQLLTAVPHWPRHLSRALGHLTRLDRATVAAMVATLPPQWSVTPGEQAAVVDFLVRRIPSAAALFRARLGP